ncbi:RNA polymerase sigma factor [Aquibacillus albus]|uniref:RNA polymerase sigma factor n=1 Tax=Aquibacillus albus TaxID=1168171 RepID=A0ABS2N4Z2_9BACI|nr:RNA polymerase sigma factor [Aquibacillus albus]MBM7573206.1 RNA polymerase sigma-70 factor (ECF subfamily) [Aquibacillus albus]
MEDIQIDETNSDFNQIFQLYYERIFSVAWNVTRDFYLAEDVVQETFVKAYKNLHRLKDQHKMGAWLSTIASRTAIDLLRKEKRSFHIPLDSILFTNEESLFPLLEVDNEMEMKLRKEEIYQEAIQLSPKLRHVFVLRFQKDLKEYEIANELNISLSAVKTRLYRAKKAMKQQLQKQQSIESEKMDVISA